MKLILKIAAVFFVLVHLTGCEDDPVKSDRELKAEMLTRTSWSHATVTNTPDGDVSDQYEDFVIAFASNTTDGIDGTYVISNGGYAFSENAGTWVFNDALDQIILDSGKSMNLQLEETRLRLEFIVPAGESGRLAGLSGKFVFDLKPL